MAQSRQATPARALHLTLTMCLVLAVTNAFHSLPARHSTMRPSSRPRSTSTTVHARKGSRGTKRTTSDGETRRSRPQVGDLLANIAAPPSSHYSVDPTDVPSGPVGEDPLAPLVHCIALAADMRKATDIAALRVTRCTTITEFVILVSGTSRPQNQAIAAAVANDVAEMFDGKRCIGNGVPEGTADSGWILLDFGEVMVHVMTPKSRLFYDLEGQWRERGGEYMDLSGVLPDGAPDEEKKDALGEQENDMLSMRERLDVQKEDDPFWS